MTIAVSPVTNNQQFGTWLIRTNQMANLFSTNTVTSDGSANGSVTSGNVYVNGFFTAVNVFNPGYLSGGTYLYPNTLQVTSNATFTGANVYINTTYFNVAALTLVTANASFTANVVTSGLLTRLAGANAYITANLNVVGTNTLLASNTTLFSGANVNIFGSNLAVTSNTVFVSNAVNIYSNLSITGTNTTINANVTITAANLNIGQFIANSSGSLFLGNGVSNTIISPTVYVIGNSTVYYVGNSTINLWVGLTSNSSVNSSVHVIGSNVYINTSSHFVGNITAANASTGIINNNSSSVTQNNIVVSFYTGNSTVNSISNTTITANAIIIGNSISNTVISANIINIGNTTINSTSVNTSILFVQGNASILGQLNVTGNIVSVGNTTGSGSYNPSLDNTYVLGNTTNRWSNVYSVYNYSNSIFSNTITVGNSSSNLSINSTMFSGTSNNSLYFGNQLPAFYTNLANYTGIIPYSSLPVNVVNTTGNFVFSGNNSFGGTNTSLTSNLTVTAAITTLNSFLTVTGANTTVNNLTVSANLNVTGPVVFSSTLVSNSLYIGNAANAVFVNSTYAVIGNSTLYSSINSTFFSQSSNNSYYLGGSLAANYIQNTDSRTLSGNLTFTGNNIFNGTNTTFNSNVSLANNLKVAGVTTASNGIFAYATSASQLTLVESNYGIILRNDDADFYILSTNSGQANSGLWNTFRPFYFSLSTGAVTIDGTGAGVTFGGGLSAYTNNSNAIVGIANTTGTGVYALSASGYAVYAVTNNGPAALSGISNSGTALLGISNSGPALIANSTSGYGAIIQSNTGVPLYVGNNSSEFLQVSANGQLYVGYDTLHQGNVTVNNGTLSVGTNTSTITGIQAFSGSGVGFYCVSNSGYSGVFNSASGHPLYASNNTVGLFDVQANGNVNIPYSLTTGNAYATSMQTANLIATVGISYPISPSNRNMFINGGFWVDQRNNGAVQIFTSATAAYSVDRWLVQLISSSGTTSCYGQRQATTGTVGPYQYVFSDASANTTQIRFGQRISRVNSYHTAGQQCTVSVKIGSASLTSIDYVVYAPTSNDNFSSLTYLTSGVISGITSSYQTFSFTFTPTSTTGLEIDFYVNNPPNSANFLYIMEPQFELGPFATPFERPKISQVLNDCYHYTYMMSSNVSGNNIIYGNGMATGSGSGQGAGQILINSVVPMRTTPTITTSAANSFAAIYNLTNSAQLISILSSKISNMGMLSFISIATGLFTQGNALMLTDAGSANSYILFSAEL